MKTKTRRQVAKYWNYDGNHDSGKDCERYDPHGFGVKLIAEMAYHSQHEFFGGVNLQNVEVKHHQKDGFGHEVTVKADPKTWRDFEAAISMSDGLKERGLW